MTTKPKVCGRCGADIADVPGHHERYDADFKTWVGFLECPDCGASYVYQRQDRQPRQLKLPRAPVQLSLF